MLQFDDLIGAAVLPYGGRRVNVAGRVGLGRGRRSRRRWRIRGTARFVLGAWPNCHTNDRRDCQNASHNPARNQHAWLQDDLPNSYESLWESRPFAGRLNSLLREQLRRVRQRDDGRLLYVCEARFQQLCNFIGRLKTFGRFFGVQFADDGRKPAGNSLD